ncbi:hypothetical protein HR060_12715 [Catenovulum sp. SM1970]|uniref:hypothetical protein n=1 Tax=Marinifaba aquimaris TaxID=2741323 RepID=UPI0015717206|nr:hypothetical protein [Marinifaba aquimaris]NTS77723.1 hypothetical protein [Marinifaba aquimaris]
MLFFHTQRVAKRKTALLLILFIFTFLCLVWLAHQVIFFFIPNDETFNFVNWLYHGDTGADTQQITSLSVGLTVTCVFSTLLAIAYKFIQLSKDGCAIASDLGGKRILPNSTHPQEKVLINVVEEMAIAASIPVPQIFILPG